MIKLSRDHPSPHDWPEDWEIDPENGAYSHVCPECSAEFTGHKHRYGPCKACASKSEAELNTRESHIARAGLNPSEWVLTLRTEWDALVGRMVWNAKEMEEERALRRKLASALVVADGTNSNVAYWGHPGRHRDTSEALLAESASLDKSLEEREKKGK